MRGNVKGLISLRGVSKSYRSAARSFEALRGVDLNVDAGECVAVVGKSGSGKTTLVNLITGIDSASAGEVQVGGAVLNSMSQEQLAVWRGRNVGLVFQFFQLLPTLTVAENVALPMEFCGMYGAAGRRARALELLERLGVADQAAKLPADLSGGQQQRAAIARALANDPPIVIADEPTGNLDSKTSDDVMEFFGGLAREGKTVLIVTHERDLCRFFTRTITLVDGAVAHEALSREVSC